LGVSAVGISTGYWLDERGVRSSIPDRLKNFHFSVLSRPALGPTKPTVQWVPEALSLGLKQQGREAGYSPPTGVQAKET
jgi:hypothetical protein